MSGYKVVLKNNKPACILLTPERYEEMTELLEDYALLMEAEERVKNAQGKTLTEKEVLAQLGITEAELQNDEV